MTIEDMDLISLTLEQLTRVSKKTGREASRRVHLVDDTRNAHSKSPGRGLRWRRKRRHSMDSGGEFKYSCKTASETLEWIHAIVHFLKPYRFFLDAHVVNFFKAIRFIQLFNSLNFYYIIKTYSACMYNNA